MNGNLVSGYYCRLTKQSGLIILLLMLITTFQGCGSKEKNTIEPDPEPPAPQPVEPQDEFFYVLSAETTLAFYEFVKGSKRADLNEKEIRHHFGNRVNYFQPDSLRIKQDSLFVYKPLGPEHAYQIKWENNQLLVRPDQHSAWISWAQRAPDSTINLSITYFKKNVKNLERSYLTGGQQYGLLDPQDLQQSDERNDTHLIWLVRNAVFTRIKK